VGGNGKLLLNIRAEFCGTKIRLIMHDSHGEKRAVGIECARLACLKAPSMRGKKGGCDSRPKTRLTSKPKDERDQNSYC